MRKLLLSICMLGALAGRAQTTLMDNFNFTGNDTLAAQSVNNGWINSATPVVLTNALRATGAPLTYTGYVGSGTGASVPFATSGQDILRDGKASYTSGNVYASFLVKVTAAQTGDYFFGLLPQTSTTAFTCRTYIKLSSTGYFKVGIMKGSATLEPVTAYSTDSFALNTTYLMVVKYEFYTGSTTNDSCKVYVFSSGIPSTEPAVAKVATVGGTNTDATAIGRVLLRQGSGTLAPTLSVSALRLSPVWADGPLRVDLNNFKGNIQNNTAILSWSTSSETNNAGFEVEKSVNGVDFEKIGFVKGAGNTNKMQEYAFADPNINSEITYYRLKQIDFDGKFEYSNTLTLGEEEMEIGVQPNPFADQITIEATSSETAVCAEVVDLNGKSKLSANGIGMVHIDTRELSSGVYFLRIYHGDHISVKRIIKN